MHEVVGVFHVQLPVALVALPEAAARHFDLAAGRAIDGIVYRAGHGAEIVG